MKLFSRVLLPFIMICTSLCAEESKSPKKFSSFDIEVEKNFLLVPISAKAPYRDFEILDEASNPIGKYNAKLDSTIGDWNAEINVSKYKGRKIKFSYEDDGKGKPSIKQVDSVPSLDFARDTGRPKYHFTPKYAEICDIVNSIFDALWMHPAGYEMTVIGQFYHFFGIVFGKHYYLESVTRTRRDYKRILQLKQVLDFIEHNYASPLTLQQLSSSVSMSPKYFCRFFSEMTHQTPMDYLNHQRIGQDCYPLTTTDASITEIAYRNGFNDLSYFIRTFKKYKGMTPGKYKRA